MKTPNKCKFDEVFFNECKDYETNLRLQRLEQKKDRMINQYGMLNSNVILINTKDMINNALKTIGIK